MAYIREGRRLTVDPSKEDGAGALDMIVYGLHLLEELAGDPKKRGRVGETHRVSLANIPVGFAALHPPYEMRS